ncbi:MAG: TonB-dependent receptor [Bacteroidota bacterium]
MKPNCKVVLSLSLLITCLCYEAYSVPRNDLPERYVEELAFTKTVALNASTLEEVTGTITDENGEALIGATVSIKGTTRGTITDTEGKFTIDANEDDILVISFVGYTSKEVPVNNQTNFTVQLLPDSTQLQDVVVVAYGTQKRSDVTGAIASANVEDFNKGIVVNPGQLLQGKVAGVNVSNVSGEPGAAQNVIIRGIGSLRSGTTPLYVVDGFVLDNTSTGVATNPLNFINPQDIESIDVLKDASAAAIYGARAANGVIVITTKKGKVGKTDINLSMSTARSTIANKIDVFSADEFRRQVVAIGGNLFDAGGNTDWQDELTQTGISQNINLSLSGAGSEKFSYFISGGYEDQEGVLVNSRLRRYSGRANLNQTGLNGRLNVDYNFTGSRTENVRPDNGAIVVDMLQLNPTIPVFTNGQPTLLDDMLNPVVRNEIYSDEAQNNRLLANISPSLEIIPGLTYKLNLGIDYSTTNRDIQLKTYQLLEGFEFGELRNVTTTNENQLVENTLTYVFEQNSHNLTLLAGHSYQRTFVHEKRFDLSSFANNDVEPKYQDQTSTQEQPTTLTSFARADELQSFFGRVNYAFDSKYLLTATLRADGSSKFGENNRYGYFPSFAAGWNLSQEDFMANSPFSNLKLRASWGQTGNQEIPSKITQASFLESKSENDTYPLDPSANTLDDYPFGTIFTRLANPDIQWEVSTQTNIGIDFGLFDYRLTGTIDYFNKVSENILLEVVPADPIQPTATFWTNVPDMEIINEGIELALEYNNDTPSGFSYIIGGNMTYIDNKVINSPFAVLTTGSATGAGQTGATINGYINGEPIGAFYMKEFIGIGPDGLNQFRDINGDDQVLENDRTVVGSALPDLLYAFNFNLRYKGFEFGANFNGVSGNQIYNHTTMSIFNRGNLASSFNTTDFAVQFPNEDITNSNEVSTRYLEDGDYLRLNNATLAYTLPIANMGLGDWISSVRFSLTGQNLFVITNYSGFDPEVNTGSSIGGVQTFGIDRFTYPAARTVQLGINVSF